MIELEQLRQLVAIADFHTISAAADALHLSQPALTRSMQRLEHELEVELFHRRRNRLGLNQTGETAVGFARILLKDADTYVDQIRAYASRLSTISIGSSPFLYVPSLLSTVTPGQFPTCAVLPVKALNNVVFPEFGLPAKANFNISHLT